MHVRQKINIYTRRCSNGDLPNSFHQDSSCSLSFCINRIHTHIIVYASRVAVRLYFHRITIFFMSTIALSFACHVYQRQWLPIPIPVLLRHQWCQSRVFFFFLFSRVNIFQDRIKYTFLLKTRVFFFIKLCTVIYSYHVRSIRKQKKKNLYKKNIVPTGR